MQEKDWMTIELQHATTVNHAMLKPAAVYFALAFAVGFVLGPVRMFVLTPHVGPVTAVLIEAPFILTASFFIARGVLRRFAIGASALQRLAIGLIAFAMLMTAELLLSLALGNSPRGFVASLVTPAGAIGVAGQILFAFIPMLVRT